MPLPEPNKEKVKTRICPYCGGSMSHKPKNQKFCSTHCSNKYNNLVPPRPTKESHIKAGQTRKKRMQLGEIPKPPVQTKESRRKAGRSISKKIELGEIPKPPRKEKKSSLTVCKSCGKSISKKNVHELCYECWKKVNFFKVLNVCPACGKIHYRTKSYEALCASSYCSSKCSSSKDNRLKLKCAECGEEVLRYPSQATSNKVFCSRRCKGRYQSHTKVGKESPFYIDGRMGVVPSIRRSKKHAEWRRKVIERDGGACVECGTVPNRPHVHHIVEISSIIRPYMELNLGEASDIVLYIKNDPDSLLWDVRNGETLCFDCHQKKHPNFILSIGDD